MGRKPCCEKVGLKRGPWTIEEDNKLVSFIINNGIVCWRNLPKLAGLLRCGKSCRLRWVNYLRPDVKRGEFTDAEDDQIIELHSRFGNKWSKIASHFPGRTDNEIKNYWNTQIKKKLKRRGLDSRTHEPIIEQIDQNNETNVEDLQHPNCSIEVKYKVNEFQDHLGHHENELQGYEHLLSSKNQRNVEGLQHSKCIDDYEMVWQSLEMEPIEMPRGSQTEANDQHNAQLIMDEDFQQWLNHVESMLLSDGLNVFNELSFQEHEHNIYSDEINSLFS